MGQGLLGARAQAGLRGRTGPRSSGLEPSIPGAVHGHQEELAPPSPVGGFHHSDQQNEQQETPGKPGAIRRPGRRQRQAGKE